MKLLFRIVIFSSAALSLLLVGIIGLTRHDANRSTYLFSRSDGSRCTLSCLFGVDLETSSFEQGTSKLLVHPAVKTENFWITKSEREDIKTGHFENGSSGTSFFMMLEASRRVTSREQIDYLAIQYRDNVISLGDVVLLLGAPDAVYLDRNDPTRAEFHARLFFSQGNTGYIVSVRMNTDVPFFDPRQSITQIQLTYSLNYPVYHWKGFNSYQIYYAEQTTVR